MELPLPLKKVATLRFEHREVVFWIGGLIFFVFCFTQFLIFPTRRQSDQLKEETLMMKKRAHELSEGGKFSLEERMISLRKQLSEMEVNLTQEGKASEVLTSFLKKANELGISVISVRPEPPALYPNAESPLNWEGRVCQALSFQMNLRCSYRELGLYLESLEKESPVTFTVDGLDIQKEVGTDSNLKVALSLTAFLFGTPP